MNTILETTGLTKHFGRIKAVQQLDLHVEQGEVFGILGPNGSGKTTALGMILGVIKPTDGNFEWFTQPGQNHNLRKKIGAILEHPIFYPFLTAVDNLRIAAHIKDIRDPDYDGLLQMVGLYERRHYAFKTYSLGMKQRLAIATALVSDPEVLIFDEPTNGLDPQGIADIRQLIRQIADMGKTIVLASHLLDEVQKVCSHFAVLKSGRKIFQGSVEEVLNQRQRIEVWSDDENSLMRALNENNSIKSTTKENGILLLEVTDDLDTRQLNHYLFNKGVVASHLAHVRSNLEEQFLAILAEDDS